LDNSFCQLHRVRSHVVLWLCQVPDDLALTSIAHLTIANEGCHYLIMANILAPCLELLWGQAGSLAEPDKRVSKAVRVEIGQTRTFKSITKNRTNWCGIAPMLPFQSDRLKLAGGSQPT